MVSFEISFTWWEKPSWRRARFPDLRLELATPDWSWQPTCSRSCLGSDLASWAGQCWWIFARSRPGSCSTSERDPWLRWDRVGAQLDRPASSSIAAVALFSADTLARRSSEWPEHHAPWMKCWLFSSLKLNKISWNSTKELRKVFRWCRNARNQLSFIRDL